MSGVEALGAQVREQRGKGSARALRRAGSTPCIVYGGGKEPLGVSLEQRIVERVAQRGDFFSRVFELNFGNETMMVLPKDVQWHPVTGVPLHVDFLRVSKTSEIRVRVPLEFINEDKSPAIKFGGILNIVQREVEISCSPLSIPEKFEIDLNGAKMGATFTVDDLNLPQGCRLYKMAEKAVLANIVQAGGKEETASEAESEAAAAS